MPGTESFHYEISVLLTGVVEVIRFSSGREVFETSLLGGVTDGHFGNSHVSPSSPFISRISGALL